VWRKAWKLARIAGAEHHPAAASADRAVAEFDLLRRNNVRWTMPRKKTSRGNRAPTVRKTLCNPTRER
jgi:hypothetical protein